MARGHQKLQSQAKAQEKAAKMKKQSGHSAGDQKKAAQKALVISCAICKVSVQHSLFKMSIIHRVNINDTTFSLSFSCLVFLLQSQMPDPKTYKQHFENKHPKTELPADLKDVTA